MLLKEVAFTSFAHLTTPMASPVQAHYANRTSNGVYDSLADLIASSGTGFLATCEYEKDFYRKTSWRGLDFQNKDGSEFRVNIFGEIQPESLGTKHSAIGDFYIGTKDKVCCYLIFFHIC